MDNKAWIAFHDTPWFHYFVSFWRQLGIHCNNKQVNAGMVHVFEHMDGTDRPAPGTLGAALPVSCPPRGALLPQ
jgi:hypothetical protein